MMDKKKKSVYNPSYINIQTKKRGDSIGNLFIICLINILAVAAWMDLRTKRIRNQLIAFGLFLGYIENILNFGWFGSIYFLIRISVPVLVFYLLFLMHTLGAGDIKLFSVIGSLIGLKALSEVVVYSFLVGAVASFIVLIRNQNLYARINYLFHYIRFLLNQKSIIKYDCESDGHQNMIHFSVAIFIGFTIFLLKNERCMNIELF